MSELDPRSQAKGPFQFAAGPAARGLKEDPMKDRVAFVHCSLVAGLSLLAVVLLGSGAQAADHDVIGKKLLLKSSPKMVLLSKDPAVAAGANGSSADPRCAPDGGGLGGSITLDDGTNNVTVSMPCANWITNGPGPLYKYKDASGVPKVGKIKAGLLKVVSLGLGAFPVPNGPATVDVDVSVGSDRYCMTFSGTGDGSKFLVKGNTTPGICGVCGNDVQEGTEDCDGADSAACFSACNSDCTCAPPGQCPVDGATGTACQKSAQPLCYDCCTSNGTCFSACGDAVVNFACSNAASNDSCAQAVNKRKEGEARESS
jgi:hypothetical protein